MRYLGFVIVLLGCLHSAYGAEEFGVELGIRQQTGYAVNWNTSTNSQLGFQGGGFFHFPMQDGLAHFRTGILYTQRPLQTEDDLTSETIDWKFDYIDIPVSLLIKPQEKFGFYLGFSVSINVNKSCSGDTNCKVSDVQTPSFLMNFGAIIKVAPKWGFNFYVDGANAAVAKGLGNFKAAGLNLMYSMN